jgi:hypothetical protein
MKVFWGFVLLTFGVAFLGINAGWWGSDVVGKLLFFWPLILIFAGISLFFKDSNFLYPVMLLAVLLAGAFIYDTAFSDHPYFIGGIIKGVELKKESRVYTFAKGKPQNLETAKYEISTGAVGFRIDSATEQLYKGMLTSNFAEPWVESKGDEKTITTTIKTESIKKNMMWFWGEMQNNFQLSVNPNPKTEITVKSGAADLAFDLSKVRISSLSVDSGASKIVTILGEAIENNAKISFSAGASEIKVRVPKSVGVKLKMETGLTTAETPDFTKNGDYFYSPEYDKAPKKIEILFKSGVSTIKVERY